MASRGLRTYKQQQQQQQQQQQPRIRYNSCWQSRSWDASLCCLGSAQRACVLRASGTAVGRASGQLHQQREAAHVNEHAAPPPEQFPEMRTEQRQQAAETCLGWGQHRGTVSMVSSKLPPMKLDQFLKWKGWVSTGGEAKQRIQMGEVEVNGSVETRRGRQLSPGDRVVLAGEESVVGDENATGP